MKENVADNNNTYLPIWEPPKRLLGYVKVLDFKSNTSSPHLHTMVAGEKKMMKKI
ncbi:hypothetical protein SESBI_45712 [Sesbania bispinosa]|nr:hypothetical protein SESBI_45712 [Sesbania bispinosa]